jgi:predicted phage-related endonuclease
MIIENVVQGSPEWAACRVGIPTASDFDCIVTMKGEPSKQRQKYLYQLAGERITGTREETYKNGSKERGIQMEEEARKLNTHVTGREVRQVGLCYPDKDKRYGCSPDGLVGDDTALEIKCPSIAVHVEYLLNNKLPSDYFQQVQGQLLVTKRHHVDFVSYYPGMDPLIISVMPDDVFLKALKKELAVFCDELEDVVKKLKGGK